MDLDALVLVIVVITALAATLFTVVPVIPGALLVPAGAIVLGFIDGWGQFGWVFWVVQAVLVGAGFAVDQVVQAAGVKRAGASSQAMWGGAIGVFAGPFALAPLIGPFALLLGPPIGAVAGTIAGEEVGRRRAEASPESPRAYHRLGAVALVAFVAGVAIRLVLVAIQVALLVFALD